MVAMILSAGEGKRMRPLTIHTPKPLLKVGGKALIVWNIERLRDAGFKRVVINVAYLGEKIMEYLGDGTNYGVEILYSNEIIEGGLETAGGIVKALPLLSETFLVINGDIWTDFNFNINFKLQEDSLAHIILIDNPPHNIEGDFYLNSSSKKYTFSGIGYYSKEIFRDLEYKRRRLAPILHNAIEQNRLTTEYYGGEWYDIGTPERLNSLDLKLSKMYKK